MSVPPHLVLRTRENWLDWARTFAIISIVFCHTTESVFQLNIHGYSQASQIEKRDCKEVCVNPIFANL